MNKSAPISPYDLGICESRHLSHRLSGLYSSDSSPAAPSGAIDECLGTIRSTVQAVNRSDPGKVDKYPKLGSDYGL